MNYVFNCLLLFAIGLNGQAVRENAADSAAISKLNSALMALNDARASQASVSEQVVEGMMLLADNEERPLRPVVERFADGLISRVGRETPEQRPANGNTAVYCRGDAQNGS